MTEIQTSPATRRRDRIKLLLGTMVETQEKVLALVTEAKDNDDHLALGYRSWTEYVKTEYAALLADLNRDDRRFAAFALGQTGMSTRAIAPILGVSPRTAAYDVGAGVQSLHTSDDAMVEATPEQVNRMVEATEDQFEEALATARSEDDLSAENVARNVEKIVSPPKMVTGIDGKHYPRPEPKVKSRQSPLPDAYWRAVYDLDKAAARLVKLTEDDRFGRHRDTLAFKHNPDLQRIGKSLWKIREALGDGDQRVLP